MKALIIEERRLLRTDEADDGDILFRILGGTPEVRLLDARSPLRTYRNREGAELDLPLNVMGTLLYREFGIVGAREVVLGNVVFFGADESGAVADVPDWVVDLAQGMVPEAKLICEALITSPN